MSKHDPNAIIGQRPTETPEAHAAFLMFVMLDPAHRSNRKVHKLLGIADSSVRLYRKKHVWDERLQQLGEGTQVELFAAGLFAGAYHERPANSITDLQRFLRVPYPKPLAVAAAVKEEAAEARKVTREKKDRDDEEVQRVVQGGADDGAAKAPDDATKDSRLSIIVNAAEIRIAQALGSGKLKVTLADAERVMRMREWLDARKRARLIETMGTSTGSTTETVAKSERVLRAAAEGGDILGAIDADLGELQLLVSTLRDSEDSNLVLLPSAREGGGA